MKIVILAAGKGTRLAPFSESTHKALLPIGNQAVISQIIAQFPKDSEFVVALGYKQEAVKSFLEVAHPEIKFHYVTVDNFEDPGSGPGHSIYCCRKFLNEPFIFTACDTLIRSPIPKVSGNWVGAMRVEDIDKWCSIKVNPDGLVNNFYYKTPAETDLAFVGIAQVWDHETFWQAMELASGKREELQVNVGLEALIPKGIRVELVDWKDTGSLQSYKALVDSFGKNFTFMGKTNEFTYQYGDRVLKYYDNTEEAARRFDRGNRLGNSTPTLLQLNGHVFSYQFQSGALLSDVLDGKECETFLNWAQIDFWGVQETPPSNFEDLLTDFYIEKSKQRLGLLFNRFFEFKSLEDQTLVINGRECSPVAQLIANSKHTVVNGGLPSAYHGDLHADNILKVKDGYSLIDWRQSFGKSIDVGDRYYDLAKFFHTLQLSVRSMRDRHFWAVSEGKEWRVWNSLTTLEVEAQNAFWNFTTLHGYDRKKISVLNGLVFINMAPLYDKDLARYLYLLGRYELTQALVEARS